MFSVYVLKSLRKNWYYVGYTSDKQNRLESHNSGRVKSTKSYTPFNLIYSEDFLTKAEAFKRELQIKRYKHGEAFKNLIKQ